MWLSNGTRPAKQKKKRKVTLGLLIRHPRGLDKLAGNQGDVPDARVAALLPVHYSRRRVFSPTNK